MRRIAQTLEQQRLLKIIRAAKALNTYPDVAWDSTRWKILQYDRSRRAHNRDSRDLVFTRRRKRPADPAVPFAAPYDDFAKAIIRTRGSLRGLSSSSQQMMMLALRFLYEPLHRSRLSDPTSLTRRHFHVALEDARRECAETSAYVIGHTLSEIAVFLNTHQLTRTWIHFKNPMACPRMGDRLDPASQAAGLKKMPSAEALEALAAISSHPLDENEQILLRIVDLLVVGGFRVGEALTLPRDCWVEETALDTRGQRITIPETGEPVRRCGIRYWPEKGGDPIVKWLPDCSVPLAKRAIDDLTRLCQKAREAAAVLEQNPDRVPLPGGFDPNHLLSMNELKYVLCLPRKTSLWRFLKSSLNVLPATRAKLGNGGHPAALYRVRDLETALLKLRGQLEVVHTSDGRTQMLSQSLCVGFQNQFAPRQPTFPFLPELVSNGQIADALGSKSDKRSSVFYRHGFTAPDGGRLKITTHAFRHWVNTLADRGGLSDVELARWMGRRDIGQNEAYKHGTVEQRVAWAQDMLKAGQLYGPTASAYQAIQEPVRKEEFLQSFVSVAHFTPYGVCTHDFALTPCLYHLNCLAGCAEYLRTQGDQQERQNLIQLRAFTVAELKKTETALAEQSRGASNWVDFNRRTLAGIDAALAIDEQGSLPARATRAVFPNGKKIGRAVRC
jgi:hypothetical protein